MLTFTSSIQNFTGVSSRRNDKKKCIRIQWGIVWPLPFKGLYFELSYFVLIYQTTWSASWEICLQVRKQQLELDMEQQTGSK